MSAPDYARLAATMDGMLRTTRATVSTAIDALDRGQPALARDVLVILRTHLDPILSDGLDKAPRKDAA